MNKMQKMITPLEGMYLIADHLRTLIFAISDGALTIKRWRRIQFENDVTKN